MNAVTIKQADLPTTASELMFNDSAFARLEQFARLMASGRSTIPQHLRGNQGDCFAIVMQAARWQMDPFAVAQKTHVTQGGQLGYEAQLINAIVVANAPVTGRPHFEFFGDWTKILGKVVEKQGRDRPDGKPGGTYFAAGWVKADEDGLGVICRLTITGEDAPREITVLLSQCYPRFSTQWATDPQQQITYAAIRKWARRYTPDVLLGVYTNDELEDVPERDMGQAEVIEKTQPTSSRDALKEKLKNRPQAAKPAPAEAAKPAPAEAETAAEAILRRVDEAVEKAAPPVDTGPTPGYQKVIALFEAATTVAELQAAGSSKEAADLTGDERKQAVSTWRKRTEELKEAAKPTEPVTVDHETGEIAGMYDQDDDSPIPGLD